MVNRPEKPNPSKPNQGCGKGNTELLRLYWELGQDIVARQMEAAWGDGFFEQLSRDLMKEFPDMKGFSSTSLKYCKRFYLFYTKDNSNRQQLADVIPHQLGAELHFVENILCKWQIFGKPPK